MKLPFELGYLIQKLPLENVKNSSVKKSKIKTELICRGDSQYPQGNIQLRECVPMMSEPSSLPWAHLITNTCSLTQAEERARGNQGNGL